jgi:co-chaperonin GroES (HSP10)
MIVPALHRILIKQDKLEEADEVYIRARKAGIEIAQTDDNKRAQASVDTGTVIEIGATAFKDFGTESPIEKGDRIAYARFSGKFVKDPTTNEEFVILNDEDICAIFK